MAAPPIDARGLRRDWGGRAVLAGLDLVVEPGDVVALRGANGAGKTTLLRVLATLLRPSGGELRLFGHDAAIHPVAARRRVGWVGHETACYPDLTGRENLAFHAALHRVDGGAERATELLAWAGLEPAADRPLRTYSRGMAQRLALARALLHRPSLLLLDEPFSGLDAESAERLAVSLHELRLAGTAVVLSSHDAERTAALATRTATLARGRIGWS